MLMSDVHILGSPPHHHEHPQWPKSPNSPRRACRCLRHKMDHNSHVRITLSYNHTTTNPTYNNSNISTNEQKKEWFLRLNPNGRIPVLVDNTKSPPFPVMETSAEL